jgi:hypothetical protein
MTTLSSSVTPRKKRMCMRMMTHLMGCKRIVVTTAHPIGCKMIVVTTKMEPNDSSDDALEVAIYAR